MSDKLNFIDVGYTGDLGVPWNKHMDLINNMLTFNPMYHPVITANHVHCNIAVSDTDGNVRFKVYRKTDCSSIFDPDPEILDKRSKSPEDMDIIDELDIACVRLDGVIASNCRDYDFLKIDTQGSDLAVLRGMGDKLKTLSGVQVEMFFTRFYKGAPMGTDIHRFMTSFGFEMLCNVRKENPLFGDHVYLNNSAPGDKVAIIKKVYGF